MRHIERGRDRQREKQAPCGEPDMGLHPRTPGSQPQPKADAQLLNHPGTHDSEVLTDVCYTLQTENTFLAFIHKKKPQQILQTPITQHAIPTIFSVHVRISNCHSNRGLGWGSVSAVPGKINSFTGSSLELMMPGSSLLQSILVYTYGCESHT